jgi:hypothetical protein
MSTKYAIKFIDNSSLDRTSLNSSKLQLNSKCSAILLTHFISFIKNGQPSCRRYSQQDFQGGGQNEPPGKTCDADHSPELPAIISNPRQV